MQQADRPDQAPGGGADEPCPFCSPELRARAVAERGAVFAVPDAQPVSPGHVLIIPRRHTRDYFTMTDAERADADRLACELRDRMVRDDPAITGFNIGSNCGASAGQQVPHAHIHLIPRRGEGQAPPVKGVIRNCFTY